MIVPGSRSQVIRRVLNKEAHRVLPRWCKVIFGGSLNVTVHEWSARRRPLPAVFPCLVEIFHRWVNDDAARVLGTNVGSGHRAEVRKFAKRQQDFDHRAFVPDVADTFDEV